MDGIIVVEKKCLVANIYSGVLCMLSFISINERLRQLGYTQSIRLVGDGLVCS